MSFTFLVRPDKNPTTLTPWISGLRTGGANAFRLYNQSAGSALPEHYVVDDVLSPFGKYIDFSTYFAAGSPSYTSMGMGYPGGANLPDNVNFSFVMGVHFPLLTLPAQIGFAGITGVSFRVWNSSLSIGMNPDRTCTFYGYNTATQRNFNNSLSGALPAWAVGERMVLVFNFEMGTPQVTTYHNGTSYGTVSSGTAYRTDIRRPVETLGIEIGTSGFYKSCEFNCDYFAIHDGIITNPEDYYPGGPGETALAALAEVNPNTWPAEASTLNDQAWLEGGASKAGTLILPAETKVILNESFGVGGNGSTGSLILPTESQVLDGVGFGGGGTEFEGNVLLPDADEVQSGILFGPDGSLSGTYTGTQREIQAAGYTVLPQMQGALAPWQQDLVFTTFTETVVNSKLVKVPDDTNFKGVWQPMGPIDLRVKPEGQRGWAWYICHAETSLELDLKSDIEYEGKGYTVMKKTDYDDYGYIEYHLVEDYEGDD